jgi:hypothetical protein
MPGFAPSIHFLANIHLLAKKDGLPGHQRVYARLRRALPGNDDLV